MKRQKPSKSDLVKRETDVINAAKAAQEISARIEQLEASETVTKRTLTGIRRELEEKQLMLDAAILSLKAAIEK